MPHRRVLAVAAVVAAGLLTIPAAAQAAGRTDVVSVPVSFAVTNTNTTTVPCTSDGAPYTVRGHITAPADALKKASSATLYLHAVTQGEFYWNFRGVPGYDYARQQADNGHVSVTIDRLGYGDSDRPPGYATCFGSQADVAHQVVQALRSGNYTAESGKPVSFQKLFIAGHSAGGLTATIEAYSYKDVDGLVNFGWADQTTAQFTAEQLAETDQRCVKSAAGLYSEPGAPPNYTPFGNDPEGILFNSAAPEVRKAVPAPAPDPCGDLTSFQNAVGADILGVPQTTAPVLIVAGSADKLFPPPALKLQAQRYTGNPDVTYQEFADTAHGFNYEAAHLDIVESVHQWLAARGG